MDEDRRRAKEAVRAMGRKEKIKYYLGYYKFHILVVAVLAILLALFIRDRMTYKKPVFFFGIMNSDRIDEQYLVEEANEILKLGEKETTMVHKNMYSSPGMESEFQDYLTVYLAADELNILFTDETGVKYMADSDACVPVENWGVGETLANREDVVFSYEGKNVAIDFSDTELFRELKLEEDIHYLLVVNKPGREEQVAAFLKAVLQ